MGQAQRNNEPEFSNAPAQGSITPLRRFTMPNIRTVPEEIFSRGMTIGACSALHDVVHAFRRAHSITEEDISAQVTSYRAAIACYPIGSAPVEMQAKIALLSSAATYADLRQGGRLCSQYPALSDESLSQCSEEIRAALVWSTFARGL